MSAEPVKAVIDHEKVAQVDDEIERLKRDGFEVEKLLAMRGVTHLFGRYDGDPSQLNRDGVVVSREGWMRQM